MLLLAKLSGILVLVWFYTTGKKLEQPAIQWAIIGLIGYWITWWLANELIISQLTGMFAKNASTVFLVAQIPVVIAWVAAFFIRKKLVANITPQ